MVVVSVGPVGGTRGSDIVSSAADVLEMSVLPGMRGVGGVCEMCLSQGGVWGFGEVMRGLGFTNPVETGGVLYVCQFLVCAGVGREYVEGSEHVLEECGDVVSV